MVRTNNHSTIHLSTISWTINKTVLGISDLRSKQYDFTLYPNPAEDFIIIESKSGFTEKTEVRITDNSGKLIKKQTIDLNKREKIDVSKLTSQIYFINVYNKGEMILSRKMIKN